MKLTSREFVRRYGCDDVSFRTQLNRLTPLPQSRIDDLFHFVMQKITSRRFNEPAARLLLEDYYADPNTLVHVGVTQASSRAETHSFSPFHLATRLGYDELASLLIQRGAVIKGTDVGLLVRNEPRLRIRPYLEDLLQGQRKLGDRLIESALELNRGEFAKFVLKQDCVFSASINTMYLGAMRDPELVRLWYSRVKGDPKVEDGMYRALLSAAEVDCKDSIRVFEELGFKLLDCYQRTGSRRVIAAVARKNGNWELLRHYRQGARCFSRGFKGEVAIVGCAALNRAYSSQNFQLFCALLDVIRNPQNFTNDELVITNAKKVASRLISPSTLREADIRNRTETFQHYTFMCHCLGLAYAISRSMEPTRCKGFKDMVSSVCRSVVLPEFVRLTRDRSSEIDYVRVIEKFRPAVASTIVGSYRDGAQPRHVTTLLRLSARWHQSLSNFYDLMCNLQDVTWPKLVEDYEARNGLILKFMTSPAELKEDAKELVHCGGMQVPYCLFENFHMASLQQPGRIDELGRRCERIATVKIEYLGPRQLREDDNAILGNKLVPDDHIARQALDEFFEAVRIGAVDLNDHDASAALHERLGMFHGRDLTMLIGFNPLTDPEEITIEHWKTRSPGSMVREVIMLDEDAYFRKFLAEVRDKDHLLFTGGKKQWPELRAKEYLAVSGLAQLLREIAEDAPLRMRRS